MNSRASSNPPSSFPLSSATMVKQQSVCLHDISAACSHTVAGVWLQAPPTQVEQGERHWDQLEQSTGTLACVSGVGGWTAWNAPEHRLLPCVCLMWQHAWQMTSALLVLFVLLDSADTLPTKYKLIFKWMFKTLWLNLLSTSSKWLIFLQNILF